MKHQIGVVLLSCVMSTLLLSGCTFTSVPLSESASQSADQSVIGEDYNSSPGSTGTSANQSASPVSTPANGAAESKPEQTPSEPIVYKEGKIMVDGDGLFEVPGELDADDFRSFALYLTVAIQNPLDSIENADGETAFRLSRCMLEYFCTTHPDIYDQIVYRETHDGFMRNYTVIPVSDFLDFTATHLGLDTLDLFKSAIPEDDDVVRFDLEEGQILFVPSMESAASEFDAGHVEIEDNVMRLYANSESKGNRVYVFDISDGIDQYRLIRVD